MDNNEQSIKGWLENSGLCRYESNHHALANLLTAIEKASQGRCLGCGTSLEVHENDCPFSVVYQTANQTLYLSEFSHLLD